MLLILMQFKITNVCSVHVGYFTSKVKHYSKTHKGYSGHMRTVQAPSDSLIPYRIFEKYIGVKKVPIRIKM